METYAQRAHAFGVGYQTVRMSVTTLANLCERLELASIDFLKIDVEGAEGDVLFGGDWKRFRPKVIVAEAVTPIASEPSWQEWEPFLLAKGYRFALFDTLNRFYVAQEHPEIMLRLPSERAPWNVVRHMYEIGRAPENKQHPDHALAQDLAHGFLASLPHLDAAIIASILSRARRTAKDEDLALLVSMVESEQFRAALGRIACGYDGGQIVDEATNPGV
jgi:hypothetical protein